MSYFILYASCIPVKGFARSIVCDLQRRSFVYIPNALHYILTSLGDQSIESVKSGFSVQEQQIVDEYFEFLIHHDFGFISDRALPNLQHLNVEHYSPETVTNAIVDVDQMSAHCYHTIAEQLDHVRCKFLQLRFFDTIDAPELHSILGAFKKSCLRSIYLVLPDADYIDKAFLQQLVDTHLRVVQVIIHSSKKKDLFLDDKNGRLTKIKVVPYPINSSDCCGEVSPGQFAINVQAFTEAVNFNSCLYKKVGIDVSGNIKNCPSSKRIYGHISRNAIGDIVEDEDFRKIGEITKDRVSVCKDCEFRYICPDCRMFLRDPSDPYSKPLKCGYDPYTAIWSDWRQRDFDEKTFVPANTAK